MLTFLSILTNPPRHMRLFSTILSAVLLASPVVAAAQEPTLYEDPAMNMEKTLEALNDRLDEEITRAEFVTIVMDAFYPAPKNDNCLEEMDANPKPPREYSLLFHDVTTRHEGALQLCRALQAGIINGYEDGNFRPDRTINLAESAKVLSRVFALSHNSEYISEYENTDWYASYVQLLINQNAIPVSIHHVSQNVTRGEVMDIVDRLNMNDTTQSTPTYEYLTR